MSSPISCSQYLLIISIIFSPPPIPFVYPPSFPLSPYFSFSPLFDYFIYHIEGVVSYHIDRAERISSSNMINKIIREIRREGKEGVYPKGMGGGEEKIDRYNEWTLKARNRWWQLIIIIPSINVFANVCNLYYVS